MFTAGYADVFAGDENWRGMQTPNSEMFSWDPDSTYVRRPPYFDGMPRQPEPVRDITGARVLAFLGDSVTTDHISPAGAIRKDSPAGRYLLEHGVAPGDFNSYGSRRGNHDVMIRGTFANIRLRNQLVPGVEGGVTRHLPGGEQQSIFDAATAYAEDGVPLIVLAGSDYGSGSSRDWAAKGTLLLGVKAVLATSFERIHRSNLVGMGVLPLQFQPGESPRRLGLTGETTSIYEASRAYIDAGIPLVVLAGKEYGSGSSRDWAAKGTALLGVRAVLAESYERIHRSNLLGMGVLPLQYAEGETAESLGLTGEETFDVVGVEAINTGDVPRTVTVRADGREFQAVVRIDTPGEAAYYRDGGIMPYVLRSLLRRK